MGSRPFAIVLAFDDADRDRFVLARHADRGWEIPGGRIEEGETPTTAARREFAEEVGHALESLAEVLVQERERGTCHVFAGRLGPNVEEGDTHDDKIEESRLVSSLDEVEPLAFPDDPYEAIEEELDVDLGVPSDG
jgi:8-oxo-dGTP pyrophosphatase MutT (NUDIX family)